MRITSLMMQMELTSGLRQRLAALAKASNQAATGLRISTVSDDPVDASQVMRMQSQIADMTQFKRNGTMLTTKLSTEDAVISSLLDNLTSLSKLGQTATSPDPTDPTRVAAENEARQIAKQIIQLGNTQVGDQYIFGGDKTSTPPFQADATYVGGATAQQVDLNGGMTVQGADTGQTVFGDALANADNLIVQLQSGTPDQISQAVAQLQQASQGVQAVQAAVGLRMQAVQQQATQLATRSSSTLDQRDALMTVDSTTALVELQQQQTALQQAYAVVGRVLQSTLLDYLK